VSTSCSHVCEAVRGCSDMFIDVCGCSEGFIECSPYTIRRVYKESTGTVVGLHREAMDTIHRKDSDCHSL
jgi:hypothetical protein